MKYSNLFFFYHINELGGIESWYYYIAKKYSKYDITIAYISGNEKQLKRLSKYVRLVKWKIGDPIECERLFVNFNTNIIEYCKYDKLIFFAHGDYKDMVLRGQLQKGVITKLIKDLGDAEYYGVSKLVADNWKQITGIDMKVCYNPIELDNPKKLIRIVSAQRMTVEKGLDRIKNLVKSLDKYASKNECLWEWDIFTNDTDKINNPSVHYKKPTLDITNYYDYYDWFVLVSDNEGFGYGVVESLLRGLPVVKTKLPVFDELGFNNSNSITLNLDCSNVDIVAYKMFTDVKQFKYKAPKSNILNLLSKKQSTYQDEINHLVKVVATNKYAAANMVDIELGRKPKENEEWETNYFRAQMLREKGYVK